MMTFFVGQMNDVKFNAMVAGDSGAGKTTFVQSFSTPFCSDAGEVSSSCTVCFYEAPEYNEYVSVECNALELQDSIEKKHEEWIRFSTMLVTDAERNAADNRIHCLFYFFGPHRIREADKCILEKVAGLVPIVPVIAKADSLTNAERTHYLNEVNTFMQELKKTSPLPVMFDFNEQGGVAASTEAVNNAYTFTQPDDAANDASTFTQPDDAEHVTGLDQSYVVHSSSRSDASVGDAESATISEHKDDFFRLPSIPAPAANPELFAHSSAYDIDSVPRLANIFAVVCSASESGLREYPWGCSVSAYDERVSDFRRLQRLVFERGNIARLRDLTQHMTIALHQEKLQLQKSGKSGKARISGKVQKGAGQVCTLLARWYEFVTVSLSLKALVGCFICYGVSLWVHNWKKFGRNA